MRIVGGGLTGILAALEAHRLGARDIELCERFEALGGVALPEERGGAELRDGCIYFGPRGDPIRGMLEAHGLSFQDFDNRFGSVSLGRRGEHDLLFTEDFGGPAVWCGDLKLGEPAGESLADRIDLYAPPIGLMLDRYCAWHLGAPLESIHHTAAIPLAINRVYPMGVDVGAVVAAKQASPRHDELFAIPRKLWGRRDNLIASLPAEGFPAFFRQVRRVLEGLRVTVRDETLVSPRAALAEHQAGDVLVWAGNPTPLFKAAGVPTPKLIPKTFHAVTFEARWTGACPFYVQNFTATGVCFRVYVYESGGKTLITAECVTEPQDGPLRREIAGWLAGFEGALTLGRQVGLSIKPRWIYHSLEAMAGLAELRATLAAKLGPAFVHGAWEPYAKAEKLAQVNAALAAALGAPGEAAAAA